MMKWYKDIALHGDDAAFSLKDGKDGLGAEQAIHSVCCISAFGIRVSR
jgi:hypothetical protein